MLFDRTLQQKCVWTAAKILFACLHERGLFVHGFLPITPTKPSPVSASMKTSPPRLAISTKGPLLAPGLPSQRRDHLVQANVGGWRQDPGSQWMGNGGFQNRWPFKFIFFLEVGKSRETDGNSTFPYVSLLFHYCFIHAYQQIPAATPCLKECASFRAKSSDWSRALRDGSRCFQSFFQTSFGKKKQVEESWKWLETKIGVWQLDFKKNDDSWMPTALQGKKRKRIVRILC